MVISLHSTMFLLIHLLSLKLIISLDPLHSTMFLLILCEAIEYDPDLYFTFHNVSINMGKWRETGEVRKVLYIPQCFY